jgi:hypothetical protein
MAFSKGEKKANICIRTESYSALGGKLYPETWKSTQQSADTIQQAPHRNANISDKSELSFGPLCLHKIQPSHMKSQAEIVEQLYLLSHRRFVVLCLPTYGIPRLLVRGFEILRNRV